MGSVSVFGGAPRTVNIVVREQFTGDGSDKTFQLDGTMGNCTLNKGTWAASQIQTSYPAHVTGTDKAPTHDSTNPITRNRIGVSSIDANGLATLDYAPRSGVSFYVWYWYQLSANDEITYYREDFVASMEEQGASIAGSISTDTTNFDGILSAADSDMQTALETIDDHLHDGRYYTEAEVDTLLAAQDSLAEMADVTITAAAVGDYLRYSGTAWVDVAVSQLESDINHDNLTGFVAAEHLSLPNTIANVLSDHNLAAHTALGLFDASSDVDHDQTTNFVAAEHVSLPNTIANVLSDHNLAAHTALGLFDASSDVDHDQTTNFLADEHVAHSGVTLTAGTGLSGGGDISASRTFAVDLNELTTETAIASGDFIAMVDITDSGSGKITFANFEAALNHDSLTGFVAAEHLSLPNTIANVLSDHNLAAHTALGLFDASSDVDHDQTTNYVANKHIDHTAVSVIAGTGLSGGGTIAADRTINIAAHAHDAETLQIDGINSDGGAFSFTTTGVVTFNQDVYITEDNLRVGQDDTLHGHLIAYGHATGSASGGEVLVYTAADHDTTIVYYRMMAYEDDLLIGMSTDDDVLKLDSNKDLYITAGSLIIPATEKLCLDGALAGDTYITESAADTLDIYAGGVQFLTLVEATQDELVINQAGADIDFRVEAVGYPSALFVQGSDGVVTLQYGQLKLGIDDTLYGNIHVYGHGAGSVTGGILDVYLAADHDTTISYYRIGVVEDDLQIGPNTDADALKLDAAKNLYLTDGDLFLQYGGVTRCWTDISTQAAIYLGIDDTLRGQIYLLGHGAGETVGGAIHLYNAADHDGTVDSYTICANTGNLTLGPIGNLDQFQVRADGLVGFGTLTGCSDTAISGYITITDEGGTQRKLAVIS